MYNVISKYAKSKEEATASRDILTELIGKVPAPFAKPAIAPSVIAEQQKAERARGKELFKQALVVTSSEDNQVKLKRMVGHSFNLLWSEVEANLVLITGVAALHAASEQVIDNSTPYIAEGMFSALRQYLFEQGMKPPFYMRVRGDTLADFLFAPYGSNSSTDGIIKVLTAGRLLPYTRSMAHGPIATDYGYRDNMMATTINDVAYLHGFKTLDDLLSLRWTSAKAGVVVKALTGCDRVAKRTADSLRNVESFDFDMYPNDTDFGAVYIDLCDSVVDSCMTGDRWDVHPCTAYSSAYHGSGDNGMVLILAKQGDGVVGRGIMSTKTNQVARWYGNHRAMLQLQKQLGLEEDESAFEGSWLALIGDADTFIHPYVDGNIDEGIIDRDNKRVWLQTSADYNLCDTDGYSRLYEEDSDYVRCSLTDEAILKTDAIWQPMTERWVSPDAEETLSIARCAMTGELIHNWLTHYRLIEGERRNVWDYVSPVTLQDWEDLGHNLGWVHKENVGNYTYDETTDRYYANEDYAELLASREENEAGAEDAA